MAKAKSKTAAKIKTLLDGHVDALKSLQSFWRETVDHPGEKGRATVAEVRERLGKILPGKYELGEGFLVSTKGKTATLVLSPQQDIVVYDRHENFARSQKNSSSLFPVEAVYATIEIKQTLDRGELRKFFAASRKLRKMAEGKRYAKFIRGGGVVKTKSITDTTAPRRFLFAMEGKNVKEAFAAVHAEGKNAETSVHGLVVLDPPTFVRRRRKRPLVYLEGEEAFVTFIRYLLVALMSFNMRPVYPRKYLRVDQSE
jgi:hypothetical protein